MALSDVCTITTNTNTNTTQTQTQVYTLTHKYYYMNNEYRKEIEKEIHEKKEKQ